MSSLSHHGIKGQRWGVRRFQNKDGTLTAAGKIRDDRRRIEKGYILKRTHRYKIDQTQNGRKYFSTNDDDAKKWSTYFNRVYSDRQYESYYKTTKDVYIAQGKDVAKAINKAFSGVDQKSGYEERVNKTLKRYKSDIKRQKQYSGEDRDAFNATMLLMLDYEKSGKRIVQVLKDMGFDGIEDVHGRDVSKDPIILFDPDEKLKLKKTRRTSFKEYREANFGHTSIGGTMYIEGNALILGDSSYLEHHGIKGQRWGIRRFQNRDGSLTNAGRKRLGYATKSAVQTVGKAFKAGVKVGGNAVKAAKAHHEEAKAKKKEKKKEKASQSRLGVLANKDLFTDDELRALNQRFKVEDELKMASIQKGVEIAKAVGTIASNAATAAKAYEDITGQSLSPIKRQAAELKKQQDAEDRARKIAREDAEEARKVAQEERNVKTYEQELRKATASADKEEFLVKKTKAQADQEILKALKGARDFNNPDDDDDDPPKPPNGGGGNPPGGGSDDGSSWVQKATAGGKNPFEKMIYDNDPEYKAAKDAHDEKVARKERMEYLDKHIAEREQEKQAEKAAKDKALMDMINQSNARTGRGQSQPETPEPTKTPKQDSDALFSQKGSLPIDKDRYRNRHAAEKAKKVKEDTAEDRAKKQDEKAVDKTIDDVIAAQRKNTESMRNMDPHAYDRAVAKGYVKDKARETINKLPETLGNLNPINRAAKKIANKVEQEGYENTRKAMKQQYEDMAKSQGRDEANYVMYNTRIAGLQGQGYSEKQARQIADSDPTFSAKRSRRSEHAQRVSELETARKNTVKKLDQAEKNTVDDYYKKIYLDAYAPGTDKREALDREYRSTMDKINRLREENQQLYDKGIKDAQKILEHSFSIQNGVLFVDESVSLSHHGIKGQRWGVRRFQNEDGSLTDKGRKHYEKAIAKIDRMQTHSDARRGRLERQHPFAVTGSAIAGAIAAGLSIAATGGASVAAIAAGSAISAAVSAGITHASYSVNEAWEGRGTRHRQKKRKEYEEMLNHDGLMVLDGTLYLAHHGVKGQRWGVRRFQNADGTRTALGKKREMYGATVSVRGQKSSESVGVTKKQAKGKAAAEILKNNKDLSEKERKKLQKHVDRAEKETAKLEKYKEKKKREQERNTEESKVRAWQALGSGVISPDKYKQNIDAINKNHKREIDYLNKMDERDMANEKAFTRKTVAKGMGYAVAATAGLAGITAAATGWMVISGYAAVGGGMVGAISGEMKRAQYREERRKEMGIDAKHDAFSIQNGTLFINAGEPYLEHHGVKGMKWGKHLMAGKGVDAEGGGGGGFAEDDEKLKEMAKKAGMSVAEYKQKFASKIGGAASKVGSAVAEAKRIFVKDRHLVVNGNRSAGTRGLAVGETGEKPKSFKEKAYDALGGKYKTQAADAHREMVQKRNNADDMARRANAQGRAANANKKAGNVREYMANKEGARQLDAEAKGARTSQWEATKKANRAQWKYDHSIAGLYDKATGKYKQTHKKTAIPNMMDRWKYEYKAGPNSKLFNNGKGKAKTAKEQAKAEVWNAADHQIKAKEHNDVANSLGGNTNYYGQMYKKAAAKEARLAEGSYRRAAALGKQASSENSTSSRPRARKKKHTSGGSGVTVRRPGRKPVSRTKRVTQSSTGVKRRGATGSGARVRRGA